MTDLIPVPDMQMVWIRLLAPKSPSFTFPDESLRMLAPGGTKNKKGLRVIQESPEDCPYPLLVQLMVSAVTVWFQRACARTLTDRTTEGER